MVRGFFRWIFGQCSRYTSQEVGCMEREIPVYPQNGTPTNAPIATARDYFEIYGQTITRLPYAEIDQIGEELWRAFEDRRKVFIFGNGGSASLASHFACDLGK